MRVTPQRVVLHRALRELDRHVTADELLDAVAERLPNVSLPTIYATLDLLEELGMVRRVQRAGTTLFDPRTEPHHHLVCTSLRLDRGPRLRARDARRSSARRERRLRARAHRGRHPRPLRALPGGLRAARRPVRPPRRTRSFEPRLAIGHHSRNGCRHDGGRERDSRMPALPGGDPGSTRCVASIATARWPRVPRDTEASAHGARRRSTRRPPVQALPFSTVAARATAPTRRIDARDVRSRRLMRAALSGRAAGAARTAGSRRGGSTPPPGACRSARAP